MPCRKTVSDLLNSFNMNVFLLFADNIPCPCQCLNFRNIIYVATHRIYNTVPDLSVEDYISATGSKHTIYMRRITGRYQAKRIRKA
ncbi:hypothetical protein Tco_0522885 [Tanacetum coccineum]